MLDLSISYRAATLVALGMLAACTETAQDDAQAWSEVAKSLPWIVEVLEHCDASKSAANDIDKARLFRLSQNMLKGVSVDGVQARVVTVNKTEAGNAYALQVAIGEKVKLATNSKKAPIKEGSSLYQKVSTLEEGQCVVVSAKRIEPLSVSQLAKICNPDYYAVFTDVKACPK